MRLQSEGRARGRSAPRAERASAFPRRRKSTPSAALIGMLPRLGLCLSLALLAAGCAHRLPAEQPSTVPPTVGRGPAPAWWHAGPALHPNWFGSGSLLDEPNGLLHVATKSGVDVVRISDGAIAWSASAHPLWVGSLDGRTHVFALSSERGAVVELEPTSGRVLRTWSGADSVQPGLSRVEGGALVVDLVTPTYREPNGIEVRRARPAAPIEQPRLFVALDREGPVAIHRARLESTTATSAATAPPSAEVRADGGKLWLFPTGDAPPVMLIDPAPPAGHAQAMFVDDRQVVLMVSNATWSEVVWRVFDAPTGALRATVPSKRCDGTLRFVGEVLLCEATDDSLRRQILALDPLTLETRWSHALLTLPAPIPYGSSGS